MATIDSDSDDGDLHASDDAGRPADAAQRKRGRRCLCVVLTVVLVTASAVGLWLLLRYLAGPNAFPWFPDAGAIGWDAAGPASGDGWCQASAPSPEWTARRCEGPGRAGSAVRLKVLTYNLFWWNLFGRRKGNWGSAGKLIAGSGQYLDYDVLGFQECGDVEWVLRDAGLAATFATLGPVNGVALAYRRAAWEALESGVQDVAEDAPEQWYGRRSAVWVRLRHRSSGLKVFFVNHHGPLPVSRPGGKCGPSATAYNLLKVIGFFAHPGDRIVLVGDFNAPRDSRTIAKLSEYLDHVFSGPSFGGVDNIFSTCARTLETRDLGTGGSDHHALMAILDIS